MLGTAAHERGRHIDLAKAEDRFEDMDGQRFLFRAVRMDDDILSFQRKPRTLRHNKEAVKQSFHCCSPRPSLSAHAPLYSRAIYLAEWSSSLTSSGIQNSFIEQFLHCFPCL